MGRLDDSTSEPGVCCRLIELDGIECSTYGGVALIDPGDGSVLERGCPQDTTPVARIRDYGDRGLCCMP